MVDVAHRHESPRFTASDWSWVAPSVARFETDAGWYRRLTGDERDEVPRRLWAEGPLKIEPWLATQDFGPFFGFTVAVRTSARLIGRSLAR
jgi:hypothetical protein